MHSVSVHRQLLRYVLENREPLLARAQPIEASQVQASHKLYSNSDIRASAILQLGSSLGFYIQILRQTLYMS